MKLIVFGMALIMAFGYHFKILFYGFVLRIFQKWIKRNFRNCKQIQFVIFPLRRLKQKSFFMVYVFIYNVYKYLGPVQFNKFQIVIDEVA